MRTRYWPCCCGSTGSSASSCPHVVRVSVPSTVATSIGDLSDHLIATHLYLDDYVGGVEAGKTSLLSDDDDFMYLLNGSATGTINTYCFAPDLGEVYWHYNAATDYASGFGIPAILNSQQSSDGKNWWAIATDVCLKWSFLSGTGLGCIGAASHPSDVGFVPQTGIIKWTKTPAQLATDIADAYDTAYGVAVSTNGVPFEVRSDGEYLFAMFDGQVFSTPRYTTRLFVKIDPTNGDVLDVWDVIADLKAAQSSDDSLQMAFASGPFLYQVDSGIGYFSGGPLGGTDHLRFTLSGAGASFVVFVVDGDDDVFANNYARTRKHQGNYYSTACVNQADPEIETGDNPVNLVNLSNWLTDSFLTYMGAAPPANGYGWGTQVTWDIDYPLATAINYDEVYTLFHLYEGCSRLNWYESDGTKRYCVPSSYSSLNPNPSGCRWSDMLIHQLNPSAVILSQ